MKKILIMTQFGIFLKARIDPTVINGGVLNSFGNSAKLGKSNWCILESDESDGSFVKIPTTYSIVTNIDEEHLDFYKSIENLKKMFDFNYYLKRIDTIFNRVFS